MDKKQILNLIEINKLNNKHFAQIYDELCKITQEPKEEILLALQNLEDEKLLIKDNKNKYATAKSRGFIRGKIIKGRRGDFFCESIETGEKILINKFNLKTAFEGDTVLAQTFKKSSTGEVVEVLKRAQENLIGTVKNMPEFTFVMPIDDKYSMNIIVPKNKNLNAKDGDKVLVHLTNFEHNNMQGEITQVMNDKQSIDLDMISIALNNGFNPQFSKETMDYAKNLPQEVSKEEIKGRVDCRNDLVITIDGDDAKDFDDAINLSINEKGNYVLKVHIADVANYVKFNSVIFNDAYERATSVYLPTLTLPMLPEELSNGICSLNPNVDRLTLCYETELNANGDVVNFNLYESVIKSTNRMTYNNVNKIFANDKSLCEKYEHLLPMLNQMKELSLKLEKKANQRGNLNISSVEPKFILNEKTKMPESFVNRPLDIAENLIENFMVLANEQGNKKMIKEMPFICRVHGKPSQEKLEMFVDTLKELGKAEFFTKDEITKKDLQNFLKKTENEENSEILHGLLLRSLQKARYSEKCDEHFGLGLKNYSHLTSPIRRLPDLIDQNLIKAFLNNKANEEYRRKMKSFVKEASEQSTEREIAATAAERQADDVAMAYVLSNHIGKTFDATVCSVTKNGLFVVVDKVVEGYIKIEDLPGGEFNKSTKTKLSLKNKSYNIFDKIKVKLASVDKSEGWISFVPETQNTCEKEENNCEKA